MTSKTYRHLVAGSTFIKPSGEILTFAGPKGGAGFYVTDKPDEHTLLDALVKSPTAQLEEVIEESAEGVVVASKAADPALEAAKQDAEKNTENASNPAVLAMQNKLGSLIAAK